MRKREAFRTITWAAGTLLIAFLLMPSHTFPRAKDYSPLVESLKDPLKDEAPLYAFNTFEEDFDGGDLNAPPVALAVTAVSGEFVGVGGGPQTWTGTAASATAMVSTRPIHNRSRTAFSRRDFR